ncbi:MAG: FxsA family protein [Actinomycetia bacterium]|nr:FxsA family protein [Actinomycetes bacterium]
MKGRTGWVVGALLLVFAAVPILEISLIVQAGRLLGVLPTLGMLLLTSALGAWLARREGRRAWTALSTAFTSGKMPTGELADAALVLTGGIMLLFPGFLTDLLGLVFLVPATRPLTRVLIAWLVARTAQKQGISLDQVTRSGPGAAQGEGVVIPGEVADPETTGETT